MSFKVLLGKCCQAGTLERFVAGQKVHVLIIHKDLPPCQNLGCSLVYGLKLIYLA